MRLLAFSFLLQLLVALHSDAGEMTSVCPFLPEVEAIRATCNEEASADVCALLAVSEDFVAAREDAGKARLARSFGLEPAVAAEIFPIVAMISPNLVDLDRCDQNATLDLMQRILATGPIQQAPGYAGSAFAIRLLGFDRDAIARMAPQMGELGKPAAVRAFDALFELLGRLGLKEKMSDWLLKNGFTSVYGGPPVSPAAGGSPSPKLAELAPLLAAVDAAAQLAAQGDVATARPRIDAAAARVSGCRQGIVLARAGTWMNLLSRYEDGLALLTRADSWLRSDGADPLCRNALLMVSLGRRTLALSLGLPLDVPIEGDPALAPLNSLFEGVFNGEELTADKAQKITADLLSLVVSGKLDIASLEPWALAIEATVPGLSNFGSPENSPSIVRNETPESSAPSLIQVFQGMLSGKTPAEGLASWKAKVNGNPVMTQLLGAIFIAVQADKQKNPKGTALALFEAVTVLERHIGANRIDDFARTFNDRYSLDLYSAAVDSHAAIGEGATAFALAERGRAFTLRRLLGGPREPLRGPSGLSAEEKEVEKKIVRIEREPAADRGELAGLFQEFVAARWQRQLLSAGSESPVFPMPVDIATLQTEVLGEGETLLAMHPGLGRYWLWRVTRKDSELVSLASEPVQAAFCLGQALRWHSVGPALREAAAARGAEVLVACPGVLPEADPAVVLYESLIAPVAARLTPGTRLIFVPHGALHNLPYAALRNPQSGRRLAEDFEVAVEPSADVLAHLRQRAKAGRPLTAARPLVMGDPATPFRPLPAAKKEAEVVAAALGVAPLLGAAATEAALIEAAGKTSLIHLAAHGTYMPESPLWSAIQLTEGEGEDGSLHVHEVWDRLDLEGVQLVVLSACDSAAGRASPSDEILGLSQSFLVAGAPAVIAALWPVDDQASAELMSAFYRYFRGGQKAAAALVAAQREMVQAGKAPYYWAGFHLIGEPDASWASRPVADAGEAP